MQNRTCFLFTRSKQVSGTSVQCYDWCIEREEKSDESRQELELFFCQKGMAAKIFVTKQFEGLSPTESSPV